MTSAIDPGEAAVTAPELNRSHQTTADLLIGTLGPALRLEAHANRDEGVQYPTTGLRPRCRESRSLNPASCGMKFNGGARSFGWAMLNLKLPAVCDVSVTNVCNAACGFCGFA